MQKIFFRLVNIAVAVVCNFLFVSCDPSTRKLNRVMDLAQNNRKELQKVLDHYADDEEKLEAARFLISNMENKYSLVNRSNEPFNEVLSLIDSLWAYGNAAIIDNGELLTNKWDSLTRVYGSPVARPMDCDFDFEVVTADFLTAHIDHVFDRWRSTQWGKAISREIFYEYMLPYRVGTEVLEPWGDVSFQEWSPRIADNKLDSVISAATHINDYNARRMSHMRLFWSYPYDFNTSQFERLRKGSCRHSVLYTAQVLRSVGIPTGVDFTRKWAGSANGHEWNVVFTEDGREHPFDAIYRGLTIDLSWRKVAKVFRKTFVAQPMDIEERYRHEIPAELIDPYAKDVTDNYLKTVDIRIPIEVSGKHKYAIISTYNRFEWLPQDWGEIKNGEACFKNMGTGNLYTVFLYGREGYTRLTEPFLLDSTGGVRFFNADFEKRQDIRLKRKTPLTPFMKDMMSFIVGNKIQGGNTYNFVDSTTFFTIDKTAENIESAVIDDRQEYRYVRMWIPKGGRGDVAELEFYGLSADQRDTVKLSGEIIGAPGADVVNNRYYRYPFDGDLLTYYMSPRNVDPWVGLDLGSPKRIVKVRYCPRSDTNFIEVGDEYELFVWDSGQWTSQGRVKAEEQVLTYTDMPSNALYILVNKTKGNEHKIFSYENDKQVWY